MEMEWIASLNEIIGRNWMFQTLEITG